MGKYTFLMFRVEIAVLWRERLHLQVQSEDLVSNIRWFSPSGDLIPQDER
jgi:hypothetical protein